MTQEIIPLCTSCAFVLMEQLSSEKKVTSYCDNCGKLTGVQRYTYQEE